MRRQPLISFAMLLPAIAACSPATEDDCRALPVVAQGIVGRAAPHCDDGPCPCNHFDLVLTIKPIARRSLTPEEARANYYDSDNPGVTVTSRGGKFAHATDAGDFAI